MELGPILASTFLHIMDSPRTRAYLRLGIDVEVCLQHITHDPQSNFIRQIALLAVTDAYGRGADHADRMRRCTKVIQLMLRTWSGMSKWIFTIIMLIPARLDVFLHGGPESH